jgi:hypothetical protein
VGLHTRLWKLATTYSWRHTDLQMEQNVKESNMLKKCVKYANLMAPASKWSVLPTSISGTNETKDFAHTKLKTR